MSSLRKGPPERGGRVPPARRPLLTRLARTFHRPELTDGARLTPMTAAPGRDGSNAGRVTWLALLTPVTVEAIVDAKSLAPRCGGAALTPPPGP